MFEKWAQDWAERIKKFSQSFDPSQFGDPVATQTKWMPIKGGGANFLTDNLIRAAPHRTEFRASIRAIVLALIFLLTGVAIIVFCLYEHFVNDSFTQSLNLIFLSAFGAIFASTGGYLLYSATTPVVFDKEQGYFWKGRQRPDKTSADNSHQCRAKLEEIHALQLISEFCGGKSTYYSYELNLVLKSGKRLNVIDHGDLATIRGQASSVSEFLDKPVWDAASREGVVDLAVHADYKRS